MQRLLPCLIPRKTNKFTRFTSHPMMINVITPLNNPNKQSASCHLKGPPALPFMPSTMQSTWRWTICPVTSSSQNSIAQQTGFNITSTLKRSTMASSIQSQKKQSPSTQSSWRTQLWKTHGFLLCQRNCIALPKEKKVSLLAPTQFSTSPMLKSDASQKIKLSGMHELSSTTAPQKMTLIKFRTLLVGTPSIILTNSPHIQPTWSLQK